jgi:hypothetical protein
MPLRIAWLIVALTLATHTGAAARELQQPDTTFTPTTKTETVYITKSGKKYHRADCRFLSKSKIALPLAEAKKYYRPCKICMPPE